HPLCYSNVTPSQGHLRSPEDTRTGTSRKARSGRGHTDARGGGRGVGEGTVILLLILAAGLLGGNELVSVSAAVLLLLRASGDRVGKECRAWWPREDDEKNERQRNERERESVTHESVEQWC